jgi:hypothetical protein
MSTTGKSREQVTEQVASLGLTEESLFFRHTRPEFLEPLEEPGTYRISANADPSEAVIDVYAGAHTTLALHLGPGLAFAESPESEWRERAHLCRTAAPGRARPGRTGVPRRVRHHRAGLVLHAAGRWSPGAAGWGPMKIRHILAAGSSSLVVE